MERKEYIDSDDDYDVNSCTTMRIRFPRREVIMGEASYRISTSATGEQDVLRK